MKVFDHITIDGAILLGHAVPAYFDALVDARESDNEWAMKLRDTALELITGKGLSATTSGTTGPAKRISIPNADLLASAQLTARTFGLKTGDRVLHCLPGDFVAGKLQLVRGFALGLNMHFIDPRGSVLDNLRIHDRFAFTAKVPLQLHRALQQDRTRVEEQFDTILLGGGPVSDALIGELQGLRTTVFIGYGSTETVTHVALRRLNGAAPEDHFTAIGECHFARDPRGCLVVYTPHLSTTQHVTNDLVELIDDTH
ncbi:MAG TPA: AMP-binding protein, partial [Flavobacteriales bacterium]|nr:AMP-binding protein [Flavobacteriales bacterium]